MRQETVSFIMMFCALMLVKNSRATLEESMMVVPLVGNAKYLAEELLNRIARPRTAPNFPS